MLSYFALLAVVMFLCCTFVLVYTFSRVLKLFFTGVLSQTLPLSVALAGLVHFSFPLVTTASDITHWFCVSRKGVNRWMMMVQEGCCFLLQADWVPECVCMHFSIWFRDRDQFCHGVSSLSDGLGMLWLSSLPSSIWLQSLTKSSVEAPFWGVPLPNLQRLFRLLGFPARPGSSAGCCGQTSPSATEAGSEVVTQHVSLKEVCRGDEINNCLARMAFPCSKAN